jgi:hypothetical protein
MIAYLLISPSKNFGKISSQKHNIDDSIKSFELTSDEINFDNWKVNVDVTYTTWNEINTLLGGEATN